MVLGTAGGSAFPAWEPHIEVWLLLVGVIGLGVYAARVIQPSAVANGGAPITSAQRRWFWLGVALLWLASDWPLHDVAEQRLYSAHMFQHMLYTVAIPPVFLLATPEWLGRLILGDGAADRWFRRLARPIPAAIGYNVLAALAHAAPVVNLAVSNGPFHYLMHTLFVATALLIWTPICGPFPELRISPPAQMFYIFLMSVIPTFPAAFLTASDEVLYRAYDHDPRLWGLSAIADQHAAGVVMKVIEGFYLWVLIFVIFLRWSRPTEAERFRGRLVAREGAAVDPSEEAAAVPAGSGLPAESPGGQRR